MSGRLTRSFYFYQATASVVFFQPVFFVYYLEVADLSLATVLGLQSYNVALRALLEVPSGVLADRWSRRGCLVASALSIAGGAMMLVAMPTLVVAVCAETAIATAHALRSGADSALLHDGMRAAGAEEAYPAAESRGRAIGSMSSAVTALVGGVLAEISLALPYFATIVAALVGATVALRLPEAEHAHETAAGRIRPAVEHARGNRAIMWVVGLAILTVVASHVYYYFQQPYLRTLGVPLWAFGFVFAATKVVTAMTASVAYRVDARVGTRGTAAIMTVVPTLGITAMALATGPAAAVLILTRGVLDGLWEPLTNVYLNRLVPTSVRATLLSLQNLASRLALSATIAILGTASGVLGLRPTLIVAAAVTLVIGASLVVTAGAMQRATTLAGGSAYDS